MQPKITSWFLIKKKTTMSFLTCFLLFLKWNGLLTEWPFCDKLRLLKIHKKNLLRKRFSLLHVETDEIKKNIWFRSRI